MTTRARRAVNKPVEGFRNFSYKEPIVIIVAGLIVLQSVVEASMMDGFTWQTLVLSGVTALIGVFMRQSVYSPARYDRDIFQTLAAVDQAVAAINESPQDFTYYYPTDTDDPA